MHRSGTMSLMPLGTMIIKAFAKIVKGGLTGVCSSTLAFPLGG